MSDLIPNLLALSLLPARPCDSCGAATPRDDLQEVRMIAHVGEVIPSCEITPHRLYWCCPPCTAAYNAR
jgi:hypothetical protein